jgi:hypothetical protein
MFPDPASHNSNVINEKGRFCDISGGISSARWAAPRFGCEVSQILEGMFPRGGCWPSSGTMTAGGAKLLIPLADGKGLKRSETSAPSNVTAEETCVKLDDMFQHKLQLRAAAAWRPTKGQSNASSRVAQRLVGLGN